MQKKLKIFQFNEVNFDLVKEYISKGQLQNFKYFLKKYNYIETESEKKYENLEPWIQWVSFYTGKTYEEHKIFYLNDDRNNNWSFYNELENKYKKKMALLFQMNLKNSFTKETFFIPDPWTETEIHTDPKTKKLFYSLQKIILQNASNKISFKDFWIISSFSLFNTSLSFKMFIIKNFVKILRYKFYKAIIFDRLCWELFKKSKEVQNSDVSSLFLNACAHIQHHYFLNSITKNVKKNPSWYIDNIDPVFECLKVYDFILGELKEFKNIEFLIATGLSQTPVKEPIFYYNLKNPELFFKELGITYYKISKRMSRDYTLEFESDESALENLKKLEDIKLNSLKFFNLKLKRSKIFLELGYEKEINSDDQLLTQNKSNIFIKNKLNFIAIKNTIHNAKGYLLSSIKDFDKPINISEINQIILKQYEK
jgi:hypothetical protein